MDRTKIKTIKYIYPQIYAYTLENFQEKEGWIKIGYTERENVDDRIKEQTHTAAVNLSYNKLWSEPAKFLNKDKWFKDKEVHKYLTKFKGVKQEPKTEWFYYNGTPEKSHTDFEDFIKEDYSQGKEKATYTLRDEQEEAVRATSNYIKNNPGKEFLWNAKPRFGKTLTTYDLIKRLNYEKILIVTNRPAIANSWFDDFEKFIDWNTDYAFVSTAESLKNRAAMTREEFMAQMMEGKNRMLAFISLQDLKGAISFGGDMDKLKWVKDLSWDLLVIDEAHEGVDTLKTDFAFEYIDRNFTLHLSGTPFKAVASGKFSDDQIYNWTYADEQEAKENWANKEANNPYEYLPKLNLFSYQLSQMITEEINKGANIDGKDYDFAFDLNEFFETKENGTFVREAEIIKWLDTLTRNEKYPFSTKELRDQLKHTFWILDRVASAKALAKLLKKHPVFENYEIVIAAGDGKEDEEDTLEDSNSLNRVRNAIKNHEKTITLSVGQLTTGITVPEWTGVLILSNMKSPSLYMQAAFRSQNPWKYKIKDQWYKKENAYVFDFSPERTLIIYDEFANNLYKKTAQGGGTSEDRKDNIRKLLNFFPVIAEDKEGKMVEIDVNQVLTIPKAIKAEQVVRQGFMSNMLFKNISRIFASSEAKEILEKLTPVKEGRLIEKDKNKEIETQEIEVDEEGNVSIDNEIVVSTTEAVFGKKVYDNISNQVKDILENPEEDSEEKIKIVLKNSLIEDTQKIAEDNNLTKKETEKILEEETNIIRREIAKENRKAQVEENQAEVEYKKEIANATSKEEINKAIEKFNNTKEKIQEEKNKKIVELVKAKTKEVAENTTKSILEKSQEKEKNKVEDDIRARLRGFARTIPSFLMAYGDQNTKLENFDQKLDGKVFLEVTGITVEQFKALRDKYEFFDEPVFDESCLEFLRKKEELADYFNEEKEEDIFDYIPPQQTNQIYTPKRVVKMMVNGMEEENPEIFKDKNKTFIDLYMKSGLYITEIVKKLYVGLEEEIKDPEARLKHILENQVYGLAPSEIIYNIARNFIFGFDEKAKNIKDNHIVCLDTKPYALGETKISLEEKLEELFGGEQ